jgi:hypothetical protein
LASLGLDFTRTRGRREATDDWKGEGAFVRYRGSD